MTKFSESEKKEKVDLLYISCFVQHHAALLSKTKAKRKVTQKKKYFI